MDKPGLPLRTLNRDLFPARERERSRSMPQEAGPVAEGAVQSTGRTFTTSCDRWNAFSAFKTPLNFLFFLLVQGVKAWAFFCRALRTRASRSSPRASVGRVLTEGVLLPASISSILWPRASTIRRKPLKNACSSSGFANVIAHTSLPFFRSASTRIINRP